MLILLSSQLSKGANHRPFTNSEIVQIIAKIKEKNLELKDLYDAEGAELLTIFFDEKAPEQKGYDFIERINALIQRQGSMAFDLMDIKKWGIQILTIFDDEYPEVFRRYLGSKAPVLLYYCGNLSLINNKFIGFSGSRMNKTDKQDEDITRRWARAAVMNNFGIVSGGATGIDTFATQEAIHHQGTFIEFLSDSMIKRIQISQISKSIQEGRGLLLSEVKPDAPFNAGMAMSRNKYIYLLAQKVIAIKAEYVVKNRKKTGGTWNGVIENIKSNYRNVHVIDNIKAKGNQELIELGAIAITDPEDQDSFDLIFSNQIQTEICADDKNDLEIKMIKILKQKSTLSQVQLTKKELEKLPLIKDAIGKVNHAFDELILDKRLYDKIYKYCHDVATGKIGEQLSLFE
jgi:predicted Rossmann fold nucleotide-binding protein DprA/Smf involved in DNA uptake